MSSSRPGTGPQGAPVVGTHTITVCLPKGAVQQLDDLEPYFRAEQARARFSLDEGATGLSRRAIASRRSRWETEKNQMRREGRLIDSRCALFTGGLVVEIAERGWNHDWPEMLHQARGRLPGSSNGGWPEKITLRIPVDLVQVVHAAIWHTHKDEIGKLRDWRDRHPRARPNRPSRPGCNKAEMEEYQRLAATITTPGDVWRAAIARGLASLRTVPAPRK